MTTHDIKDGPSALRLGLIGLALLLLPTVAVFAPAAYAEEEMPTEKPADAATEGEDVEEVEEKAELPWVMDVGAAKEQAAKEKKTLFINFTGSDWCGWCKKLDAEVFEHASFVDAATKDFVFLFLDFPKAQELKDKVVDPELNDELKNAYGVQGFPTLILALADGTPYARASYQAGGPESYLEYLEGFKPAREAIEKLVANEKHDDVEALKAAFPFIEEHGFLEHAAFAWTLDAAEKADPKGELGLLPIVEKVRQQKIAKAEWDEFVKVLPQSRGEQPDFDKIVPAFLKLEHQAGPGFLQFAINVSMGVLQAGRPEDAKKMLDKVKDDPFFTENERAGQILEQVTTQVDEALKAAEESEAEEETEPETAEGEDEKEDGDEPK